MTSASRNRPRTQSNPLRKYAWLALLVPCLITSNQTAQTAEREPEPPKFELDKPADSQDLLLLGPLEPTRLRVRVLIDGEPFRSVWETTFDRLFDQYDSDHDSKLTSEQAVMIARSFGTNLTVAPTSAGSMHPALISREQLKEQFERTAPPLKLIQKLSSGGAGPALAPLLDLDEDGRLSREELTLAGQSLHCRDFDGDQLITEQELVAGPVLADVNPQNELGPGNGTVILLTQTMDQTAVAEILLARYDRNRDGMLSLRAPLEVQAEAGLLATLDKDHDQILTRTELRGYLDLPHDAELPFALGGDGKKQKGTAAAGFRLRSKLDGGFRLQVGSREINFRRNSRNPINDESRLRIQDYDGDSNGYLDSPEYANIVDKPDFAVIDANHDEKISSGEFDAFFQRRLQAIAVQVLLEATEHGADLFRSLDLNGDRVLTPRELLHAPELLDTNDQDKDGFLGGAEMSYNLVLEISRGNPKNVNNPNAAMRTPLKPRVRSERSGPAWFLKMDRNRDGDIDPFEFPGDRKIFIQLDTNADGLLSSDEATTAMPRRKGSE